MLRRSLTFRVFVSSTFTDMRAERKILQEEVFPRLKALCESKGATFQDVDLRWGVNEESQLDQKTIDICLGEIARCQRLSPKPNFIILLGDKYGWQPVPSRIPTSEMERILEQLVEDENAVVDRWYHEDLNAVPPKYVLQPRVGEYLSHEKWTREEVRLREILRKAATLLPFTEAQKVKYFASATHQEILAGALNPASGVLDPAEHVFAYMRKIRGLPEDERGKNYFDVFNNGRDEYSKKQLEILKQELRAKLPHEHIYSYNAHWNNTCVMEDAKAFGAKVYGNLSSVIESQLQKIQDVEPLEMEIRQHEAFKKQHLEHFTGRKVALAAIRDYLNSDSNKALSIIGASGTGKTALIAKAIEEASDRGENTVFRFIGTTSATSNTYLLLSDLIREIAQKYGTDINALLKEEEDEQQFLTLRGLQEILPRCLGLAQKEKPLYLFLDALDQLSQDYASLPLDWIPREIPKNVRIVLSALPALKEKLAWTNTYELGAMSTEDGEMLLDTWLGSVSRTLQPHQKQEMLEKFASDGTPLYLRLVFERARTWHSYFEHRRISVDVDGVIDEYFRELEKTHGNLLVQKICGYLLSGKYEGLTEQELLDLLVFDEEFWRYFLMHCHPDHRQEVQGMGKLPIVVWSRLFLDLEPYLTEREAGGLSLISFYHRNFLGYLRATYLPDPIPYHRMLADYFEKSPIYLDENEERPNRRKVAEQPYEEILSEKWADICDKTLANFPFLMAKAKANMVEEIIEDYAFLWDRSPESIKVHLDLWRSFFRERAHILRRENAEWPAYKIFLQLAVEHADDSPVTIGSEQWLQSERCDWPWLRRIQRVAHAEKSSCLAVFEGHTDYVNGALETNNGCFLSWSRDNTLRFWDRYGKCIAVFEWDTWQLGGVLETSDGRFLSWSGEILRLWDRDGHLLTKFEGHTSQVKGSLETSDGRFLSWSQDNTLRLWDRDGKSLAVLEGHTSSVNGAFETNNGCFLSWSQDRTLWLWNRDGHLLTIFEGHTSQVKGALETSDGRFLSWSYDNSLRLWDRDDKSLAVLEGHTRLTRGALETSDGRFLSWSDDNTLRLWDRNGKFLVVLEGHKSQVKGALETSGGRFLSWSPDNTLRLWDRDGKSLAVLEGYTHQTRGSPETSDGRFLSWPQVSTPRLWDRDGKFLVDLKGHKSRVKGLLETSDGRFLSWSDDNTLRLWDRDGKSLAVLEGHTDSVNGALETNDGHFLSWSDDRTLRLWDRNGKSLDVLERHMGSIPDILETRSGRFLSYSRFPFELDLFLRLWDRDGKSLAVLEGHTSSVNGALETNDGHFLSWSDDNTLRLWDRDGKFLVVLEGHKSRVNGALETNDGHFLSWSDDNTLRLWDRDGKFLVVLEGHKSQVNGALETSDGRFLSWSGKILRLWDRDGHLLTIFEGHTSQVNGALETNDGHFLSWSDDNTLRLWDRDGKFLVVLEGHTSEVRGALETSDGRFLSWSGDRTLRLWNRDGHLLTIFEGHTSQVKGALEISDGRFFSLSEVDRTLRILRFWDRNGKALASYPIRDDLHFFTVTEFRIAYSGLENSASLSFFGANFKTGRLTHFSETATYKLFWHGESICFPRYLKPEGLAILTQANGQVCFLRLYYGNKPISVEEWEKLKLNPVIFDNTALEKLEKQPLRTRSMQKDNIKHSKIMDEKLPFIEHIMQLRNLLYYLPLLWLLASFCSVVILNGGWMKQIITAPIYGFILVYPLLCFQIWKFMRPGLLGRELAFALSIMAAIPIVISALAFAFSYIDYLWIILIKLNFLSESIMLIAKAIVMLLGPLLLGMILICSVDLQIVKSIIRILRIVIIVLIAIYLILLLAPAIISWAIFVIMELILCSFSFRYILQRRRKR